MLARVEQSLPGITNARKRLARDRLFHCLGYGIIPKRSQSFTLQDTIQRCQQELLTKGFSKKYIPKTSKTCPGEDVRACHDVLRMPTSFSSTDAAQIHPRHFPLKSPSTAMKSTFTPPSMLNLFSASISFNVHNLFKGFNRSAGWKHAVGTIFPQQDPKPGFSLSF